MATGNSTRHGVSCSTFINKDERSEPQLPKTKRVMIKTEFGYEEQIFQPLVSDLLPEEFKAMATTELNETEQNRIQGLQKLRELIKREKQPYCMNDEFLLSFLRCKKFNIKKAERKLREFSHINQILMEFVTSLDVAKVRAMLDNRVLALLPYRDKRGRTVAYTRGCGWKPELFSLEDVVSCFFALGIFASSFPATSVCGICYIPDCKVNSIYDVYHVISQCKKNIPHIMHAPLRVKSVAVINENMLFRCFFKVIRSILPSELFKRISMHGTDLESLHKIYHPSLLPADFGGTLEDSENELWKEHFLEFLQKLKHDFEQCGKENITTCS